VAGATATAALLPGAPVGAAPAPARPRFKLGIATYSYWHFRTAKVPIETVIDKAAALGVEGVDILHRQMDIPERGELNAETRAYCQKLKRHAFRHGIDLIAFSVHQDFVDPDPEKRQRDVEHTHMHPLELRPLEHHPQFRRSHEGPRRGADHPRLHRGRRIQVVHRLHREVPAQGR
jgi:hypothetical protein